MSNLVKTYPGGITATCDLNLTIEAGEFLAVVGPSGCGKSTMLRMLVGMEKPDSGSITIDGNDAGGLSPMERDVAMVFQDHALYPHMTVRQNMLFALQARKVSKATIAHRIDEAADLLQIRDILERLPATLSGGQHQRVALGKAVVRRPAIFVLDEPFNNLDASLRLTLRNVLKELQSRRRITTIFVTHDQQEAMMLGERIAVMRAGAIRQTGTPRDVCLNPVDRFVAEFIGSPGMNIIAGRLTDRGGKVYFSVEDFLLELSGLGVDTLSRIVSKDVLLGVRPESMVVEASCEAPQDGDFVAKVQSLEIVGDRMDVCVDLSGQHCVIRTNIRDDLSVGKRVFVRPDPSRVHLFARDKDGKNLIR